MADDDGSAIYTIGHSNHEWEAFADLLKRHGIELLVDTRSRPASRYAAFANIPVLPGLLEAEGIDYQFMGGALGGKPADASLYDSKGKPDYRRMRMQDEFQEGIAILAGMAARQRVAILCSEEDPTKCHRRLLIGPALEEQGVKSLHIRADGALNNADSLSGKKAYQRQLQGTLGI